MATINHALAQRDVYRKLLQTAQRLVGRGDLAHDLVQETYVAAIERWSSFEHRSSVTTWMTGILRRKAIDHHRRRVRERLCDRDVELETTHAESHTEPGVQIDRSRALEVTARSLTLLSSHERRAFMLVHVDDAERVEVAEALAIDAANLRVLLHRGRVKLRRAIEAHAA